MIRSERYVEWLHAGNLHGMWGAIVMTIFSGVAAGAGFPGATHALVLIPTAAIIGFAVGKAIGFALLEGSGRAAQAVHMPEAAGTYVPTHSHIDAMEARGDLAGAAAAWEAAAVQRPHDPWPLIRCGELYLRNLGEPGMALDRFRLAREAEGATPEQVRFISQKIIDLYLGPLHDEGRAMVELRRLVEQHPNTREAHGARLALQRLKAP